MSTLSIVLLDASTLGDLKEVALFSKFGKVESYATTAPEQVATRIKDADIVITNKVVLSKALIDQAPKLSLICVAATGTNNIDVEYATAKGVQVKNVKGYSTASVAQHTFALLFHCLNSIAKYDAFVKNGTYSASPIFTSLDWPIYEFASMKLGIIGFGAIGQKVAQIAESFGAEVHYYSTSGKNQQEKYKSVSLDELLRTSDIVSIHAPLNDATQNLLGYSEMASMKSSAVLINVGRGGIVEEEALVKILDEKKIAFAAMDVFSKEPIEAGHPFLALKNNERLLLTPHIAWAGVESRIRLIEGIAANIDAFLKQ